MWHPIALKFLKVPEKRKNFVKKLNTVDFDIRIVYWRHLNQKLCNLHQSRAKLSFHIHYTSEHYIISQKFWLLNPATPKTKLKMFLFQLKRFVCSHLLICTLPIWLKMRSSLCSLGYISPRRFFPKLWS